MKRLLCLLLILALSLSLWGCGRKNKDPEPAGDAREESGELPGIQLFSPSEDSSAAPPSTPDTRHYQVVEINSSNWSTYFQLQEIPLYSISSFGDSEVISQVCQNYCVVLRDEYQDWVIGGGDYQVEFTFSFDVYYNTLDVDTKNKIYNHTSDFGYPDAPVYGQDDSGSHTSPLKEATATKTAVFDRDALRSSAYGTDFSLYHGYRNAFYSGWAKINLESKVWSGVYIDLSQVRLENVSGSLYLAN